MKNYEAIIEALLFASGHKVEASEMASVLGLDNKELIDIMERLIKKYDENNGGLMIRKIKDGYQMCSRPEYHDDIKEYFEQPQKQGLTRAAMETLSVVAYNQPITRAGIEFIRGVNSDSSLLKLVERGLVKEVGRSDGPGRPILYGTTDNFLRSVGISSLAELPPLQENVASDISETDEE